MKFTIVSTLLFTLPIAISAREFGLLVIRSGSIYHYSSILSKNDKLILGSRTDYSVNLNQDGTVTNADGSKYLSQNDDNQYVFGKIKDPEFGITQNHFTSKGSWYACPASDGTVYLTSKCDDGLPITLLAIATTRSTTLSTSTIIRPSGAGVPILEKKDAASLYNVVVSCGACSVNSAAIKRVEGHPHVFSVGGDDGTNVQFKVFSNGTMVDGTGRGIYVNSGTGEVGLVSPWSDQVATAGFSIVGNKLAFKNLITFRSCPAGSGAASLSVLDCMGGVSIALDLSNE